MLSKDGNSLVVIDIPLDHFRRVSNAINKNKGTRITAINLFFLTNFSISGFKFICCFTFFFPCF